MGRRRMKNYNPMAIAESPMTAPDSRDSVERVVAEMRDCARPDTPFSGVLTLWADRLQALARGPQQAGGEDAVQVAARIASEAACLRIDNERLQAEVARLRKGIVHRGDDAVMPAHLYDEINASGAEWKDRAETAEAALREDQRDAERWRFLTSMDVGEYIGLVEYNNPDKLAHAIDAIRLVRDGDSGEG